MPATSLWILLTFLAASSVHPVSAAARKGQAAAGRRTNAAAAAAPAKHARPSGSAATSPARSPKKAARPADARSRPGAAQRAATPARPAPGQASARSAREAGPDLSRARDLLRAVKKDPVRRRYKHEWEKAIAALERAAKGSDRPAALLDAARARYALYRFSSDEGDRERALALARRAQSAGSRDAATFIAAVRREAGDDADSRRVASRERARPAAGSRPPPAPQRKSVPKPSGPVEAGPPRREPAGPAAAPAAIASAEPDEPPDTDPVLDRILAQLAEDPAEDPAPTSANPEKTGATPTPASAPRAGSYAAAVAEDRSSAPAEHPAVAAAPASPAPVPAPERRTAPEQAAAPPRIPDADERLAITESLKDERPSGPIRKIVIDPGHGGHDTGAIGPTRVREKDVVLAIAKRLARKLEAGGYEVVLTREDDRYLALAERTALANAHQGDLFVSIHANAHPRRDRDGVETWVLDVSSDRYATRLAARENGIVDDADSPMDVRRILADLDAKVSAQASRRLARTVQQEVTTGIRGRFGPVRDLGVKSALFYVLLGARMPAVLIETSFISNRAEEKRLVSPRFQDELASAITRAIDTFAAQQQRIAAR